MNVTEFRSGHVEIDRGLKNDLASPKPRINAPFLHFHPFLKTNFMSLLFFFLPYSDFFFKKKEK